MDSQLLAYLESLDPTTKSKSDRADIRGQVQNFNPVHAVIFSLNSILVLLPHSLYTKLSDGFIRDISLVLTLHSNLQAKLEIYAAVSSIIRYFPSARSVNSQLYSDILRRGILVYLFLSCALYLCVKREEGTDCSILNPLLRSILWTTLSLISAPIIFGTLASRWIDHMLVVCRRTETTTGAAIGWVKRGM